MQKEVLDDDMDVVSRLNAQISLRLRFPRLSTTLCVFQSACYAKPSEEKNGTPHNAISTTVDQPPTTSKTEPEDAEPQATALANAVRTEAVHHE